MVHGGRMPTKESPVSPKSKFVAARLKSGVASSCQHCEREAFFAAEIAVMLNASGPWLATARICSHSKAARVMRLMVVGWKVSSV